MSYDEWKSGANHPANSELVEFEEPEPEPEWQDEMEELDLEVTPPSLWDLVDEWEPER